MGGVRRFPVRYFVGGRSKGQLATGADVFLDIEVQGADQVKSQVPDVVKVFVYPPVVCGAVMTRLRERRQDHPEAIHRRLQWALYVSFGRR